MAIPVSLHLLAAVIWVGGMFFSLIVLRPCCMEMEPPVRLALMTKAVKRFFNWVWLAVVLLLLTGYWMIYAVYGGFAQLHWHIDAMLLLGNVMAIIFLVAFFGPYRKMQSALAAQDNPGAGASLNIIRKLIMANLTLGLSLVLFGSLGRYL
ncbi:MAG: CopD family protein [Gammaproteobacteria bacterium]|nr:CopD family protein [Gammaproteobacteria bacterium]